MLRKIFYYGWIPIFGLIVVLKIFVLNNESFKYTGFNFVQSNNHLIGKETNNFKIINLDHTGDSVFTRIKLFNVNYNDQSDKNKLSSMLNNAVKNGKTCKDNEILEYLNAGVILNYDYVDNKGNFITSIMVDKQFCIN